VHLTLRPWDCAAGVLLIREAGGAVSRPDGGPWTLRDPQILASNTPLHDRLATIAQAAMDGAGG
jgi:myo-inositol-1(or 4)-monophosphatase